MLRHDGGEERIELEPLLTFRMRGIGYTHPEWGHGHWHGEHATGAEEHKVEELDNVEPWNIHVQQVMRARWGDKEGLGVLEQLAFGEHRPSGLTGILDGYRALNAHPVRDRRVRAVPGFPTCRSSRRRTP